MTGAGYDGSIRIDSSIDSSGFNSGVNKFSDSMKNAMGKIAGAAVIVGTVLAAAAISAVVLGTKLIEAMTRAINPASAYGQQLAEINRLFADVKGACFAAFSPLISAALPWIKTVVAWLTNFLNQVAMVIAHMSGQKTVMQYVAGSADTAATATGRLAGETNKVKKAAAGALASFDAINVLQQNAADNAAGGGAGAGTMGMKEVDVDLSPAAQKVDDFFTMVGKLGLQALTIGGWIQDQLAVGWANFSSWFLNNVTLPIAKWFVDAAVAVGVAFGRIVIWAGTAALNISAWFMRAANDINTWFVNAWGNIQVLWANVSSWFLNNVIEPIKKGFQAGLTWISNTWSSIFTGIENIVRNSVNKILGFINDIIAGVNRAIGALNRLPGFNIPGILSIGLLPGSGYAPPLTPIRGLASGSVIAPNAPFAAMLGDQSSGRNIESPESLIRQIVREETQGMGKNINLSLEFKGTLAQFVRELRPVLKLEDKRIGGSLIVSGETG
jgi:hypothetical protein